MPNLTIRNVDDATVAALKARAKKQNRSLEGEIRTILHEAVSPPNRAELVALVNRITAMTPDVPQTNSVALLREDRNR